jgi:5-methylcytosine-specific restriction endonuclease McrBC GTP-binding regulatory subunit McrB
MNHQRFAKELLEYLNTLTGYEKIANWTFVTKTKIAYGSPGGAWNDVPGFLFNSEGDQFSFIIRSIPSKTKSYIVIESSNMRNQLYNIDLTNSSSFEDRSGSSYLLESYVMTIGKKGKQKVSEVKKAFFGLGKTTNQITEVDNLNPDWPKAISDILEWGILREKVKLKLKNDVSEINLEPDLKIPSTMQQNQSINQILFGPPGTGKTYASISRALEIISDAEVAEIKFDDRKAVKSLFDKKVADGQIDFTTFHQNMSYEDFIEGIKPKTTAKEDIIYKVEDGLFKTMCKNALANILSQTTTKQSPTFDDLHEAFLSAIAPDKGTNNLVFATINDKKLKYVDLKGTSIIVKFQFGDTKGTVAGTEPFTVSKAKLKTLFEANVNPDEGKTLGELFNAYFTYNHSVFYAVYKKFWDFVKDKYGPEELSEIINAADHSYDALLEKWNVIEPAQQKQMIAKAANFVVIIDEINRGNVSKIFGELITLIEDSKRIGNDESLIAKLPYSKTDFAVPPNVYIIGTMNTADRSVEALDTALRRRFSFEEMAPNPGLKELNNYTVFDDIVPSTILRTLNKRIEKLLDKDHLIGHSFFIKADEEVGADMSYDAFYRNIIPLLQEYFYGDYSKIGLILGNKFVSVEKSVSTIFADSRDFEGNDYNDKKIYTINSFKDADQTVNMNEFEVALRHLLGGTVANSAIPEIINEATETEHQN